MMDLQDISHVVELRYDETIKCPLCGSWDTATAPTLADKITHMLSHGYQLLHVGQQTVESEQGIPRQTTIAVLGLQRDRLNAAIHL